MAPDSCTSIRNCGSACRRPWWAGGAIGIGGRSTALNHGEPVFAQTAEKYEGGMLPFPSIYGMGAVIDLMLQIGPAAIEARVLELAGKARAMLRGLGAEVNADESPIVTAILPGRDAGELARSLKEQRILVSARHGRLRVSPHFYNDETDLETLRKALAQLLAFVQNPKHYCLREAGDLDCFELIAREAFRRHRQDTVCPRRMDQAIWWGLKDSRSGSSGVIDDATILVSWVRNAANKALRSLEAFRPHHDDVHRVAYVTHGTPDCHAPFVSVRQHRFHHQQINIAVLGHLPRRGGPEQNDPVRTRNR